MTDKSGCPKRYTKKTWRNQRISWGFSETNWGSWVAGSVGLLLDMTLGYLGYTPWKTNECPLKNSWKMIVSFLSGLRFWGHTVDGRNPAPVGRQFIPSRWCRISSINSSKSSGENHLFAIFEAKFWPKLPSFPDCFYVQRGCWPKFGDTPRNLTYIYIDR